MCLASKVVLSSYIDVREVTEPAWEKANLEFDLKSDIQENNPKSLPNSSEATVAFSRTTTPATAVTATSASTPESRSTTTSTTLTSTTLAIPDDLLGVTMTTSSTHKSETTAATTRRTTTIPDYHTNLVEELRALREEYELHGVCLQC